MKWREMVHLISAGNLLKERSKHNGFSYLAMLFIVAVLAVTLTQTYQRSDTLAKREKEKQLFFVGSQYKQALTSYYNQSPSGFKELPKKIDDLVSDSRFVSTKRHLRKQYLDPITGGALNLILDGNGRIKGVYSSSTGEILQTTLFEEVNATALAAEKKPMRTYADIKFEYILEENNQNQADSLNEDGRLPSSIDEF